ncbi:MAG: helicase, partial [Rivularia sp. (in: cyanobacteria)]
MQTITLPTILPGELNLEELNQKLRQGTAQLDWSAVISAPESQLNILLNHLDLDKDADSLGVEGEIAENIANDIIRYFDNKNKKSKKSTSKSQSKQKQNNKITLVRSEGFIPHPPSETEEDFATDEEIPPTPLIEGGLESKTQLKPPSPYEIRAKLEQAILADLLGPAGGENEEIDESSVRDRYLVGLLAPQRQQVSLEQQDELAVAGSGNTEEGTTESNT